MPQKRARSARSPARRKTRQWCVPPAVLCDPQEAFEGERILHEFPGELGLLLWRCSCDVSLWAMADPAQHPRLFAPGAAETRRTLLARHHAAADALEPLLGVLDGSSAAGGERVAATCARISRWAAERGAPATALAFAQAGALAHPYDAAAALATGRSAMTAGARARTETWLRRAFSLARKSGDWTVYTAAFLELGRLQAGAGLEGPARAAFLRASRAARRHGLRELRGLAQAELFRLANRRGHDTAADRYGMQALRALGRSHPESAALVLELARLWVEGGDAVRGQALIQRHLPLRAPAPARLRLLALSARAAAAVNDAAMLDDAWQQAWRLAPRLSGTEAADALLDLARAADRAGDAERRTRAARAALHAAQHVEGARAIIDEVRALVEGPA